MRCHKGTILLGAVAVLGAGCIMSVDLLQLAEQAKKKQREAATGRPADLEAWEPAALATPKGSSSRKTDFRVRVYADEEYRLGNLRWQEHIKALVAAASDYTDEGFGARLTIESIRPWKRNGAKDSTGQLLAALRANDEGSEVDWVIGFGSPLGFLTSSIHEIGMAQMLSKHFVMRGIDDHEDAAALAKNFSKLSDEDRAAFLARRREHKELVVFLHEWLHTLGAIHHVDREMLLHPSYAHQQRSVDDDNAGLVELALEARIQARNKGTVPDYSGVRAYLADVQPATWYGAEREQLLASLPPPTTPAPAASKVPARAVVATTATPAPLTLASASPPAAPVPLRAAVEQGHWDEAIASCLASATSAGALETAELCARAGMIHLAERRVGDGAGSASARLTIAAARQRFGVPPGDRAVTPQDEAARARVWFTVRAALDARELNQARTALEPALRRFADDCGLLTLRCETDVRRSQSGKDADGSCERALALWNDMPRALFWSGLAQANRGDRAGAIVRLQRARTLEPEFDGPWKVLADLYTFEGRRKELGTLRSDYQARFGKPLR
jgi:hypothetical protein